MNAVCRGPFATNTEQGEGGRKETLRGAESNHSKISTILSSRRRVTSHPKRAQKFENSIPNLFVAGSVPELSLIVSLTHLPYQ